MPRATELQYARRRSFGAAVRAERTKQGLSQEALALEAGLDRTYVGSVERGERNVSLDNIWLLADTLKVAPPSLLEGRLEPNLDA